MMKYLCFLQYIKSGSSIKEVDKLHIDNMVEGIGMSVSLDKKSVYVVTSDMVNNWIVRAHVIYHPLEKY